MELFINMIFKGRMRDFFRIRKIISLLLVVFAFADSANAQTYDGYTLYFPQGGTKAYLVDMSGANYHTWTFSSSATTTYASYLLSGGILLRTVNHSGNYFTGGPISGEVQKVDWNGTVLWDFVYSTTNYCSHHDIHPMPNGNVLLIAYERKTAAEATQAGCSQSIEMWPDKIVEIQPSGTNGGTVVWEWHAWDHLVQHYDASKSNYGVVSAHPELLNINYNTSKDWMHVNGIDYNAALDQITFSSHSLNEIYVIDHSTTTAQAASHSGGNSGKGGDFIYRWGNPAAYETSGTTDFNVVHDAHWVPATNPSYPNALCGYNNKGGTGGKTCVDIFIPPYNGYNYTLVAGQAYGPSTYAWRHTYSGTVQQDNGSSQQLPNGNTLLCMGMNGFIYEINSSQTQVWSKNVGTTLAQSFRYPPCFMPGATYTATASATPSTICAGNSTQLNVTVTGGVAYTYSWTSNPSGFTSTIQSPTVSPTITTVYTVTVTNGPCSATANVTVTVNQPPTVNATATPSSICIGSSSQLNAAASGGSGFSYSWTSNPAGFTSTLQNPVVTPLVTTNYYVAVTNSNGCVGNSSCTVQVNAIPTVTASATPSTICSGSTTQLNASVSGGSDPTFAWTSNPPGFTSSIQNPVVAPTVTTVYYVAVTSNGCTGNSSTTVTVNANPTVTVTATPSEICAGGTSQLHAEPAGGSGYTYSWTSVPVGFTSTLQNPVASPTVSTNYYVTVTSSGCQGSGSTGVLVNSNKTLTLHLFLEGLYAGSGTMNPVYDDVGPHYGSNIADKVTIELHNASDYGTTVYVSSPLDLSTSGNVILSNIPGTYNNSYYIAVKHRNSIETVSAAAISFSGCTINYDFSSNASKAFGDNMSNWNGQGVYVIWSGDVNQDGIIDSGDINPVDNASTMITLGYADEDVNGDGIVDSSDLNFVDNNSTAIIIAMTP
jgi:hypothetical protein